MPISRSSSLLAEEEVSLDQCRDAGLVSLEEVDDSNRDCVVVSMPLMVSVIMDRISRVLPSTIQLDNPFGADWETLERVAMACLLVQLGADGPVVSLEALRPGASLFADAKVKVNVPRRLDFYYLGTYLEGDALLRGKKADGGFAKLEFGDVMVTATNQFAHDGVAMLEGIVNAESVPILWLTQTKAVDGINKITGEKSSSTLYNGSIQSTILPKMRKGAAQFKAKFPQYKDAFVVYDIFSDREAPKKDNGAFTLDQNEALFVTRSDTLPTVLGGFVARIREIADK